LHVRAEVAAAPAVVGWAARVCAVAVYVEVGERAVAALQVDDA
jgi:hypothetical protein